ncbi:MULTISPECIES: hypothetical protein [unclassified Mucilaginibacter]|uniref:hypothetical protein n=1 Tax=unclassified Mucilaginibacter TaxID=2617802 RepID=UPI002AC974AC|nr:MULTISPECIES: hypothetical protein [unclassified Mucilaginibacter]MEB0261527.1 hypothetical protein [Mucilaginibacter sp. 10I4]MEB0277836.1 hypothetical protein [Mucilaginibacter sp. 10B2]MEB0300617.1 hypothetical protein [Mucilaginibacter sp. 5C4]WPX22729.1 hypothetical protein RHM67_15715 [Mucilaginibacter sp. 5C4]
MPDVISGIGNNSSSDAQRLLDAELKAAQLPGFFEIYLKVKEALPKVLKRQKINSIEEYYAIIEIVSDTTNNLTQNDTDILNNAIRAFELSAKPDPNKV